MTKTVFYELYNNSLSTGTGIATYGRNLTSAAKQLGYRVEGLYHSTRSVSKRSPLLNEIMLYDARGNENTQFTKYAYLASHWAVGAPLGINSGPLASDGIVIRGGTRESVDQRHVARYFYDVARLHFKRYGARAMLRINSRVDIFHATQAIPLKIRGAANLYTIHDLVPLRLPHATLDDKRYFFDLARYLCETADHIVTVSESSRQDLIKIVGAKPERVTNTYQSVSFPPALLQTPESDIINFVQGALEMDYKGYFLFYGAVEPKKNVSRLIDAYLGSGSKRPLIIAGGLGWNYGEEIERIREIDVGALRIVGRRITPERRVVRVGRLPLTQLVALIRGAQAVLFPSLYEGFGLPVLESMLLGTPVMTSKTSSLAEVAGDAASLVDPYDVSMMSRAIAQLDADADYRSELARRGGVQAAKFSPEACGARIDALYRKFVG